MAKKYMTEYELMLEFSNNLKRVLHEHNLTQKKLAYMIDVEQPEISSYLNCKRLPSVKTFINIVYVLNIDPKDLLEFFYRVK